VSATAATGPGRAIPIPGRERTPCSGDVG
jgi:hypothetical protein